VTDTVEGTGGWPNGADGTGSGPSDARTDDGTDTTAGTGDVPAGTGGAELADEDEEEDDDEDCVRRRRLTARRGRRDALERTPSGCDWEARTAA